MPTPWLNPFVNMGPVVLIVLFYHFISSNGHKVKNVVQRGSIFGHNLSTVEPRYHDAQGTEGNSSSFPGINTSIRTFNCTILAVIGMGDIR